jgi:cell division protein FtsZ
MFELVDAVPACKAKMKVIGIGGGGINAVNMMFSYNLEGVDFITANTYSRKLDVSSAPIKIQLGMELTRGLGAGGNIDVGKRAAIEAKDLLHRHLEGADMVFITAGLGGGTGTGGAPVVAEICKDIGALTIALVTKPFHFEGKVRNEQAEKGIAELRRIVDTLIVIPNQRLLDNSTKDITFLEAFNKADDILYNAVKSISDLMLVLGRINVDFADVKTIMSHKGLALIGTGVASGDNRAIKATQKSISSPLMENNSIHGAHGVLLNITGGSDFSLFELNEASTLVHGHVHEDAHIIIGTIIDENMGDEIRVTVIATGIDAL